MNVVATLPAFYLIDRLGRRPLLIWGAVFMTIFQLIVAICGVTISVDNLAGQRVLVAFVCLYIASFALTWGTVAWVVNAEIFPLAVRAKAMSMTGASNWAVNFAIGYAIPYLVNDGPGNAGLGVKVFFLWGSLCAFCGIYSCTSTAISLTSPLTYVYLDFFIPETKGLSLEQINLLFLNTTPRKSAAYRNELLASAQTSVTEILPTLRHSTSQTSSDPEKSSEKEK